jgi:YgiT-type zinc finger domain-containing protein
MEMSCSFCGGALEERLVHHEYRWAWKLERQGKLFVFEDVPARVCRQCGEKYFDAHVVKAMERAVLHQLKPTRILRVPLFTYPDVAGVDA